MLEVFDIKAEENDGHSWAEFIDEEYFRAKKYLDSLDLLPLLTPGKDIAELYVEVHNLYNDEYDGEDMYDCFSSMDFAEYIEERFHFNLLWTVVRHMRIPSDAQKGTRYDTNAVSDLPEME